MGTNSVNTKENKKSLQMETNQHKLALRIQNNYKQCYNKLTWKVTTNGYKRKQNWIGPCFVLTFGVNIWNRRCIPQGIKPILDTLFRVQPDSLCTWATMIRICPYDFGKCACNVLRTDSGKQKFSRRCCIDHTTQD